MISETIISLRKLHNLTQEELAEKIGVTRQTLSKWELGDSSPDFDKARQIAEIFDVSLDELASGAPASFPMSHKPNGKHMFGIVKVGEKGQIVIPVKARKIFDINPGDNLIVLGDENSGIALMPEKGFMALVNMISKAKEES